MSKAISWWRNSAIYQVYPRSFQDSNGDGEGDLRGVIARLDYLKSLGIDAIWLSPFYRSPNRDGGYDVADPRDVDPKFGKLDDATALIDEAHKRNLRIIFDIVPNHFSTEHIWFKEALNSPKGSPARSRFHFMMEGVQMASLLRITGILFSVALHGLESWKQMAQKVSGTYIYSIRHRPT